MRIIDRHFRAVFGVVICLAWLTISSGCAGKDSTAPIVPPPPAAPPPPPPPVVDTRPASVVVVSGKEVTGGKAQLALRNDSGPGAYYVDFHLKGAYQNLPGKVNPTPYYVTMGAVEIKPGYAETLIYDLRYNFQTHVIGFARVYSRASNSGAWKVTSCWAHFEQC